MGTAYGTCRSDALYATHPQPVRSGICGPRVERSNQQHRSVSLAFGGGGDRNLRSAVAAIHIVQIDTENGIFEAMDIFGGLPTGLDRKHNEQYSRSEKIFRNAQPDELG